MGNDGTNFVVSHDYCWYNFVDLHLYKEMSMLMIKHILLLVIFSILAVFFKDQLVYVLHGLLFLHNEIANGLGVIFSNDSVGMVLQAVIALLLIPIFIGVVVSLVHWMFKHTLYPRIMEVIWIAWAILVVTMLSQVMPVAATAAAAVS